MNREHWRQMLPVIQAFVEGKTVQQRLGDFQDVDDPKFDCAPHSYRIKPTPRLRPWRPEEVPVGAVVQHKYSDARMLIVCVLSTGTVQIGQEEEATVEELADEWELLDGSPCGVEEAAE